MPSPSSNALDLESVVDFIHDQCKNQNELENNGKKSINGDVEPMITSLSQPVTILKASAKITPIIITEIKAPTQTTSKEKSKVLLACTPSLLHNCPLKRLRDKCFVEIV